MNHTIIDPTLRQSVPRLATFMAWTDPHGVERSGEIVDVLRDEVGVLRLKVRWAEGFVQCIPADAADLRPLREDPPEGPVVTVEGEERVRGGQLAGAVSIAKKRLARSHIWSREEERPMTVYCPRRGRWSEESEW